MQTKKSRPRVEINQPHVNLYGTSNPNDLFKCITEEMISSGFFGRMICFFPLIEYPKLERNAKITDPPISLVRDLSAWANYTIPPPWNSGNIEGFVKHNANIIKMTEQAKDVFYEYDDIFFKKGLKYQFNKNLDALWMRGVEEAKKFSILFTCSNARVPGDMEPVSRRMAEDCCEDVETLTARTCLELSRNVTGSDFEALQKKIIETIRRTGEQGASGSTICCSTRPWKPVDRNSAIDVLLQSGIILVEKRIIGTSRQKTSFYFIKK